MAKNTRKMEKMTGTEEPVQITTEPAQGELMKKKEKKTGPEKSWIGRFN